MTLTHVRTKVASWPPSVRRCSCKRGGSIVELLIVLALAGVLAGTLVGATSSLRVERGAREAARVLLHDLQQVALLARRRQQSLGVAFEQRIEGDVLTVYADGNGNGVRAADIAAGIDRPLAPTRHVFREGQARLAVARTVPASDGDGVVLAGSEPVRFGIAAHLTFSARGTGPSGSLYVAGPSGTQYVIRVLGTTGRLRLSCFDARRQRWEGC